MLLVTDDIGTSAWDFLKLKREGVMPVGFKSHGLN